MTSPNDLKRIKAWLGGNPNSSIHAISKATGISFYLVKKAMEELDAAKEVTWDFSTRTWSMAKKVEDLARDVEAKVEELEAGQADQQAPLAPSPDPTPTPQLTVVPPPELQPCGCRCRHNVQEREHISSPCWECKNGSKYEEQLALPAPKEDLPQGWEMREHDREGAAKAIQKALLERGIQLTDDAKKMVPCCPPSYGPCLLSPIGEDEEEGEEITIMPQELPRPKPKELMVMMQLHYGTPLVDPNTGRMLLPIGADGMTIMVDITEQVVQALVPPGQTLQLHLTLRRMQ